MLLYKSLWFSSVPPYKLANSASDVPSSLFFLNQGTLNSSLVQQLPVLLFGGAVFGHISQQALLIPPLTTSSFLIFCPWLSVFTVVYHSWHTFSPLILFLDPEMSQAVPSWRAPLANGNPVCRLTPPPVSTHLLPLPVLSDTEKSPDNLGEATNRSKTAMPPSVLPRAPTPPGMDKTNAHRDTRQSVVPTHRKQEQSSKPEEKASSPQLTPPTPPMPPPTPRISHRATPELSPIPTERVFCACCCDRADLLSDKANIATPCRHNKVVNGELKMKNQIQAAIMYMHKRKKGGHDQ